MDKGRITGLMARVVGWVLVLSTPVAAQSVPFDGRAVDAQGLALPGVTVELHQSDAFVTSAVTDRTGTFHLTAPTAGDYRIEATLLGFRPSTAAVTVRPGMAPYTLTLQLGAFAQQVTVTAGMPEIANDFILPGQQIENRVAQDVAASLRAVTGVTSLRRGAINLDPNVRGLYAEQLGVFVDGTRTFAAGPARMDSALSHVSPHALQSLQVVKGPYALTWGAGTLSAIRAETFKPAFTRGPLRLNGRAGYNGGGNGAVNDGFAGLWGSTDRLRFMVQHNTRTGRDYRDGHGTTIPGGYESYDTRWDFGVRPGDRTRIEYTGGYQKQDDIDYPGRILDATYFETTSHDLEVAYASPAGLVSEVAGQLYVNDKNHRMNNDAKPTALDMPGRVPPFGIDVDLPATSTTTGGAFHVSLDRARMRYRVGTDFYRLEQSATRTISRRSNGVVLFTDRVWPDARVTNLGVYGQAVHDGARTTVAATGRLDTEQATVGVVSDFFRAHTTGAVDQANTTLSGAVSTSLRVNDHLLLSLGAGRAVRAPSVLERYSDRFPAVKFQTAAEFMGNPALVPEKSLEVNAGTVARVGPMTVQADVFRRRIADYITIAPDASLPRRLPLSPTLVYRYVQEGAATFSGLDAEASSAIGTWVNVRAAWSYVRATDEARDEPLFGVAPFQQRYTVRVHADESRWVELVTTVTARQNRVAASRLEMPTEGWHTVDLQGEWDLTDGVSLRAGVLNLADAFYANHLNSLNPFTGQRIAEVGRRAYAGLQYEF